METTRQLTGSALHAVELDDGRLLQQRLGHAARALLQNPDALLERPLVLLGVRQAIQQTLHLVARQAGGGGGLDVAADDARRAGAFGVLRK